MLVECRAPRALILDRLAARESGAAHESDARTDLLEEFEERYEPIDELPSSEYLRLDTSRPVDENASQLESTFGG